MAFNLTQTLINSRLVTGNPKPGNEIALRIDQALLQDVLSTLVMLELDAMGVERVNIGLAAQYIDHNLLETDNRNGDEHLILRSACPGSASGTAGAETADKYWLQATRDIPITACCYPKSHRRAL